MQCKGDPAPEDLVKQHGVLLAGKSPQPLGVRVVFSLVMFALIRG